MITIELIQQLKEAGFPIQYNMAKHVLNKPFGTVLDETREYGYKSPTLSELIEACGDGFKGLLPPNFPLMELTNKWGAIVDIGWIIPIKKDSTPYFKTKYKDWYFYVGSTPEEAVVKLWLELNKVTKNKA